MAQHSHDLRYTGIWQGIRGAIDTALVTKVLQPLWTTKPETARRVRGRIEAILDWAKACGYRDGENPARFRGHLKHLLADVPEVRRVKHHAALPYAEIAEFVARPAGPARHRSKGAGIHDLDRRKDRRSDRRALE